MADRKIEEQVVFMLGQPAGPGDKPVLIFGIPDKAWDQMRDGRGHDFDFTAVGLPVQAVIFRGKDHADIMRQLQGAAAAADLPVLDQRREDFRIPALDPKRKGPGK
jgi:hypothetical protein